MSARGNKRQKIATSTADPALTIIHPQGNLDFIIGGGTHRLRVLTQVLSPASEPFALMLSPTYAEGQQQFSAEKPGEIELLEDDPEALKILCCLLHMQWEMAGLDTMSSRNILDVVIVADKYGAISAVYPPLMSRYHAIVAGPGYRLKGETKAVSNYELLAAMYMMDDRQNFRAMSQELVTGYIEGSIDSLKDSDIAMILGDAKWLLDIQRSESRSEIFRRINDVAATFLANVEGWTMEGLSTNDAKLDAQTVKRRISDSLPSKLLRLCKTWDSKTLLVEIKKDLEYFRIAYGERKLYMQSSPHNPNGYDQFLDHIARIVDITYPNGLCLVCCKEGNKSASSCNASHDDDKIAASN